MKHYFRPGRGDFRAAIMKVMPRMLAERLRSSAKEQVLKILEGMTAKSWRKDRDEVARLLANP